MGGGRSYRQKEFKPYGKYRKYLNKYDKSGINDGWKYMSNR